ncbi:dihydroorotase [Curvivirga aplysinae]|uniref:dihydroorotase n=1 Tax=Curvivirga aplysinae TaxID=2529852 RepID=UPI001F1F1DB8|nr:dihydroorotase [Curvivirga aplysinae]
MDSITIKRPDDWHLHIRDGKMMEAVLPYTASVFGRAIIMPNLTPPVITAQDAVEYHERIMAALPKDTQFKPLMTAYLTDNTDPDDIAKGFQENAFVAVKLYPAHATTNSAHGVSDITKVDAVVKRMSEIGMPLLIHGEVTRSEVDIYDREAVFIQETLMPLKEKYPDLKVVLEHITTSEAVDFVKAADDTVAATITPQHIIINRSDMFRGGIRPHLYCLPIAKREKHRLAVREAAVSGHKSFFLGTDSAPHPIGAKESSCGCAGIFNVPAAIETYLEVFEEERKIENFEAFASLNGPAFYEMPVNEDSITIVKQDWNMENEIVIDETTSLHPFKGGKTVTWKVQ